MCDQLTYDNAFVYFQPGRFPFPIDKHLYFALISLIGSSHIFGYFCVPFFVRMHFCFISYPCIGNGKVKIKEPTDLALKAQSQIQEAIKIVSAN